MGDYVSGSGVEIEVSPYKFHTRFEYEISPKTCAAFESAMPFTREIIHVRWSGVDASW